MSSVRERGALLVVVLGVVLAGCADERAADSRPLVAMSVLPQRSIVESIAGDRVRTQVMIPPGASPASYEPTFQQMLALEEAALYVKVGHPGFPFEHAWLDRLLAQTPGLEVLDASAGLPRDSGDPHLWLTPKHVVHMADRIAAALEEVLPGDAAALQENLVALREHAGVIDRQVRARLAAHEGEAFFVFHPAWGAFAAEYGLRQIAVEHEHKEPGPRELQEIIARARSARARVVFAQPQFDQTSAEAIAREIGARVEVLDPLAPDWDQNLLRAAAAIADSLEE